MHCDAQSFRFAAKEKRPTKPKTAAQLYADSECEAMIVQSGLHENQSKLAVKSCKDDALAAFKQGRVKQPIVDKFEEKEQGTICVLLTCSCGLPKGRLPRGNTRDIYPVLERPCPAVGVTRSCMRKGLMVFPAQQEYSAACA